MKILQGSDENPDLFYLGVLSRLIKIGFKNWPI